MRVSVTQKVTQIKQGTIKLKSNMLTYTLCSVTWNITLNKKKKKKTQYCYFEIKGMFESRKKWNIFITKGNYPSVTDYICPQWLLLILMRKKIALRRCRELF